MRAASMALRRPPRCAAISAGAAGAEVYERFVFELHAVDPSGDPRRTSHLRSVVPRPYPTTATALLRNVVGYMAT